MSIFDVNFQNFTQNLVPVNKQVKGFLGWIWSLIFPIQWRHDINFISYWQGSTDPQYSLSDTYTQGQRIVFWNQANGSYYGDNAVYEANTSVPINTPPIAANQVNAEGVGYWIPVQTNFIGENERINYRSIKLLFEYALNRWFHTTFRQPQAGTSDIYITTNTNAYLQGFFTPNTQNSFFTNKTNTGKNPVSSYFFPGNSIITNYDFTIHIPLAVYNALSPTSSRREGIVRGFANIIAPAGMNFNILTY